MINRFIKHISVGLVICLPVIISAFLFVPSSISLTLEGSTQTDSQRSDASLLPKYNPPDQLMENRRREAGMSETGTGSASRGWSRGYARGIARGTARGLARGWARGIDQGDTQASDLRQTQKLARMLRGDQTGEEIKDGETSDVFATLPTQMAPLASTHTGLTAKSQPTLRFYISDPWPGDIEFALNAPKEKEPLLETYIEGPFVEGIYKIDLSQHNILLQPGVEYEWLIAISPDPEERSADFLGSATIKYIAPSAALQESITKCDEDRLHFLYAEQGYWYDAIDIVSRLIENKDIKDKKAFKAQRSALLKQVHLTRASEYDQKR